MAVIYAVGNPYQAVVQEGSARVHDAGDVAVPLIRARGQQRSTRITRDARRVIEVEQHGTDDVDPHRTDAMGEHKPALVGLDWRTAVADLQHLPRRVRFLTDHRPVPTETS